MAFNWLSLKKSNKSFRNTSRFFSPELLPLESRLNPYSFTANLNLLPNNVVELTLTSIGTGVAANDITISNPDQNTITIDAGTGNDILITNNTNNNLSVIPSTASQKVDIELNTVQISNLKIVGSFGQDKINLQKVSGLNTAQSFGVEIDTSTYSNGNSNDTLTISGPVNLVSQGGFITSNVSPERNLASITINSTGSITGESGLVRLTANKDSSQGITFQSGGYVQTDLGDIILEANNTASTPGYIRLNGAAVKSNTGAIQFLSNVFLETDSTVSNTNNNITFAKGIGGQQATKFRDLTVQTNGEALFSENIGYPNTIGVDPVGNVQITGAPQKVTVRGNINAISFQTVPAVAGPIEIFGYQNYQSLPNNIQITSSGSNYTSAPLVAISGNGGATAEATLQIDAYTETIQGISSTFTTANINFTNPTGTGYSSNDEIRITGLINPASPGYVSAPVIVNGTGGIIGFGPISPAVNSFNVLTLTNLSFSIVDKTTGAASAGTGANISFNGNIPATGANYNVGDILTVPGNLNISNNNPVTFRVAAKNATGGIISISNLQNTNKGVYNSTINFNQYSVTGGSGTGAKFDFIAGLPVGYQLYNPLTPSIIGVTGKDYNPSLEVLLSDGNTTDMAKANITTDTFGAITSLNITYPGSGYNDLVAINVMQPGNSNYTAATLNFLGSVKNVNITNFGSGYVTPPSVIFAPSQPGSGAVAVAGVTTGQFLSLATSGISGNITLHGNIDLNLNSPLNLTHSGILTIGGNINHGILNEIPAIGGDPLVQLGLDLPIQIFMDSGVLFNSPVLLGQNTILKTGSGGNITFNSVLNGPRVLSMDTTGEITFLDDIGNAGAPPTIQTINSPAYKFNFNTANKSINAVSMNILTTGDVIITGDQTYEGSGLTITTLGDLLSPGDITLGNIYSLAGSSGGVTISNAGTLYLNGNIDIDGPFVQASFVNNAYITNTGTNYSSSPVISFTGGDATTQAQGQVSLSITDFTLPAVSSGSGYSVGDLYNVIDPSGEPNQIPALVRVTGITSNGGVSTLNVLQFGSGFYNLNNLALVPTGSGTGTGARGSFTGQVTGIKINNRGYGYRSNPTISFSGGQGNGATAFATISDSQNGVEISTASGSEITLKTNQQNVFFGSHVTLNQNFVILTGQTGTADVSLNSIDSAQINGVSTNLNLDIEAAGDITFNGSVGSLATLGDINLARTTSQSFSVPNVADQIRAKTLIVTSADNILIFAEQTYTGVLATNADYALSLSTQSAAGDVKLGKITTSAAGILLNNAGDATLLGNVDAKGTFQQIGNSSVYIGDQINDFTLETNGSDIMFNGDVLLKSNTTIISNGGDITFDNLIDGRVDFTVVATNTVNPSQTGGNVTMGNRLGFDPLGKISIMDAHSVVIVGSILAESMNISAATGPVVLTGSARFIPATANPVEESLIISTISSLGTVVLQSGVDAPAGVRISNQGMLTIPDAGDISISNGSFVQNGTGSVSIASDINTIKGDIQFSAPVFFTGNSIFSASRDNSLGATSGTFLENINLTSATVNTVSDEISVAFNISKWQTGMVVVPVGNTPSGILAGTTYYAIRVSSTKIKLATSLVNAQAGQGVNITSPGVGTMTFTVPTSTNLSTISFASEVNGFGNVTLNSTGTINFNKDVGNISPMGTLQINNDYVSFDSFGLSTQFKGNLTTNRFSILKSTGSVVFNGNAVIQSQLATGATNFNMKFNGSNTLIGGQANFSNGGLVTLKGNTVFSGPVSFSNAASLEVQDNLSATSNMTILRPVTVTGPLNLNLGAPTNVISGAITSNENITINATSSKLSLTGDSTNYNGQLIINSGVNLQVGANFLNATGKINGGTLSGNGKIGTVYGLAGSMAPGSSTGTFTVNGTMTLNYTTVTSVQIQNGGGNYVVSPSVVIVGGGGSNATAVARLSISSLSVVNAGSGYAVGDLVTILGSQNVAQAKVTAVLGGGSIQSLQVTNPGNGYSSLAGLSIVKVTGNGSGGTVNGVGYVGSVSVTNPGENYTATPGVSFTSNDGGSGASATATVGSPNSNFVVNVNGASAGKYSQARVLNGTTLKNVNLSVPAASNLVVGQRITIINNGLSQVGTFNNLPEGSQFTVGNTTVNTTFSISYIGGDGNDVVLTVVGVNSAPVSSPVAGGDGIPKFFAVGTDYGGGPVVSLNFTNGHNIMFYAYSPNYRGGVRVTLGDVNGDGYDDLITGTGIGGGPHVKVWDIRGVAAGGIPVLMSNFFAFEPNFMGGTNLATGDINNDGMADILVGAGTGGGPRVKVFAGASSFVINPYAPLMDLFAYNPAFTGGVVVAAGDRDGDAVADVITGAGFGGGPNIRSFNAASIMIENFLAFSPEITTGIFIAAGNVDGDGIADIIAGTGFGTTTQIAAFYSGGTVARAVPFTTYFIGGARPGVVLNADGTQSFAVSAGPGGAPEVQVLNNSLGATDAFFAINPLFSGGLFLNTTL